MKIDAGGVNPSEIQTDWSARQAAANTSPAQTQTEKGDRTTLSRDTATVRSLVGQAMTTPEVRQDKVAQLRQAVSSGSYKVDTQGLAAALVDNDTE